MEASAEVRVCNVGIWREAGDRVYMGLREEEPQVFASVGKSERCSAGRGSKGAVGGNGKENILRDWVISVERWGVRQINDERKLRWSLLWVTAEESSTGVDASLYECIGGLRNGWKLLMGWT